MLDPLVDRSIATTGENGDSSSDASRERNSHRLSSRPEHAPIPESFICPLTKTLMKNPVIDREGNSYEKDAILRHIQLVGLSPVTENPLQASDLVENKALQIAIQAAFQGKLERSTKRPKVYQFRIADSLLSSMKGAMNKVSPTLDSSMTLSSVEKDGGDAPPEKQRKQLDPEPPSVEEHQQEQRARARSKSRTNRLTARRENVRQTWHSSMTTGSATLDIRTAALVQARATYASLPSALRTAPDARSASPQQTMVKDGALEVMPEGAAEKATLPNAESSLRRKNKSAEERFEARLRKKLTEYPCARAGYERSNKVTEETDPGAEEVLKCKKNDTVANYQTTEPKRENLPEKQLLAADTIQHALRMRNGASSGRDQIESSKRSKFEGRLRRKILAHNHSIAKPQNRSHASPVSRKNQDNARSDPTIPRGDSRDSRSKFEIVPSKEPDNLQRNFQTDRRGKGGQTMLNEKLESRQQSASVQVENREDASSGQTPPERKSARGGSSDFENDRSNGPQNLEIKCQKARRIKERRTILDEKLKLRQRSASVDVEPAAENKGSSRRRNVTGRRSRERRLMRAALNEKIKSMTHNTHSRAQAKASTASTRDPTVGGSVKSLDRSPKVGVLQPWELASFGQFSDLTLTSFEEEPQGTPKLNPSWNSNAGGAAEARSPGEGPSPPVPHSSASSNSMPVTGRAPGKISSRGAISERLDSVPPRSLAADRRDSVVSWTDHAGEIEQAQFLSMRITDAGAIDTQRDIKADGRADARDDRPSEGDAGRAAPRRRPRGGWPEDIEALSLAAVHGDEADAMISLGIFEGSGKTIFDVLNALRDTSGDVQRALGNLLGFEPSTRNYLL